MSKDIENIKKYTGIIVSSEKPSLEEKINELKENKKLLKTELKAELVTELKRELETIKSKQSLNAGSICELKYNNEITHNDDITHMLLVSITSKTQLTTFDFESIKKPGINFSGWSTAAGISASCETCNFENIVLPLQLKIIVPGDKYNQIINLVSYTPVIR